MPQLLGSFQSTCEQITSISSSFSSSSLRCTVNTHRRHVARCAGTIDEKIYQRQLMKGQIADMMEGQGTSKGKKAGAGSRFSVEELKELFKLRLDTASDTQDLLCKGSADKSTSCAVLCCAALRCVVLCCAVLCCAVLCCAVQCCAQSAHAH